VNEKARYKELNRMFAYKLTRHKTTRKKFTLRCSLKISSEDADYKLLEQQKVNASLSHMNRMTE